MLPRQRKQPRFRISCHSDVRTLPGRQHVGDGHGLKSGVRVLVLRETPELTLGWHH